MRCEGPMCVDPGHPGWHLSSILYFFTIDFSDGGQTQLNSVEEGAIAKFSCERIILQI